MEWWVGAEAEAVRGWVVAIGGLLALTFAARTYAMNSREKRESQARLVYVSFSSRWVPAGSQEGWAKRDADWWSDRSMSEDLLPPVEGRDKGAWSYTFEVVNGSDELIWPVLLRVREARPPGATGPTLFTTELLHPIEPKGRTEKSLPTRNHWAIEPYITFCDSSGRWWSRRGAYPVRRRLVAHTDTWRGSWAWKGSLTKRRRSANWTAPPGDAGSSPAA